MAFKSISLAVLALTVSTSLNAALITENFNITVVSDGFQSETGTGSFSYESSNITGTGVEVINSSQSLSLSFDIFGQSFTQSNDVSYPFSPDLTFIDGVATELDFAVYEISCSDCGPVEFQNLTNINQEGITSFGVWSLTSINNGDYEVELEVNEIFPSAVPIPAAAWLFGSGLIGLVGLARRKK